MGLLPLRATRVAAEQGNDASAEGPQSWTLGANKSKQRAWYGCSKCEQAFVDLRSVLP